MVVHVPPNPTSESDFQKQSHQPISSSYGVFWQLKSHFSHGVYHLVWSSDPVYVTHQGYLCMGLNMNNLYQTEGLHHKLGWMESGVWKNWAGRLLLGVIGLRCFDLKHSFWNVPVVNPITSWKCCTYLLEYPLTWMSCKMVVLGSVSYVYSKASCFVISSGLLAANTACCPPA